MDYENTTLEEIIEAAKRGDSTAQYMLGMEYMIGNKLQRDEEESQKWLWLSAKQGNPYGEFAVGGILYQAHKDDEAVEWFKKAAEKGYRDAQWLYGKCLYDGEGVSVNREEAIKWIKKAADQGLPIAKRNLKIALSQSASTSSGCMLPIIGMVFFICLSMFMV